MKGLRWQVQSGKGIRFWEDKWAPSLPGLKLMSRKPDGCDIEWVANAIDKDRGAWNKDKLRLVISKEEIQAISLIPVSFFQREDSLVWHYSSNGVYTVKSGWVRTVWFGCDIQLNIGHGFPISIQGWTSQVVDDLKGRDLTQFLSRVVTIAQCSKTRNEFVFSSNPINPEMIVRRALEAVREFSEIRVSNLVHTDNSSFGDSLSQGGLHKCRIEEESREKPCIQLVYGTYDHNLLPSQPAYSEALLDQTATKEALQN
ncbi:hypothetical protein RHSIM_Rhsim05G0174000 [Rhododendron simsii]|uniref:Uncharacterized protein n=1 Tax=Rhododendron simsii TaxID=118357 RepID=A0A834GW78_RHOSS|nr:hypothetical protein RHSIM_Rhsim05G0174000 [Rhododendron simsii]